jgi:DNA polymerase-3 subunit alpha
MYSNIRLLDCINRPKALIDKARELGLSGVMITDHECLSAHMEVNQYAKQLLEIDPDFTIALGNEIYLTDTRDSGQKYYHFILGAKDELGHKALREMSSIAWYNSYVDRRMERVPLLKSEMKEIMSRYKGHVVATTACMGGELSTLALGMKLAEDVNDMKNAKVYYDKIIEFLNFCTDVFGEDFYIECAPSSFEDQIMVNQKLLKIAKACNIRMVLGTDAHYLTAEERPVHSAYLNSKEGEREVDSFYRFAHLMTPEEAFELLMLSYEDEDVIHWIMDGTEEVRQKMSFYSLERKQIIPKVEVTDYPKLTPMGFEKYPTIQYLLNSDEIQERYWINECLQELKAKGLHQNEEYIERIEIEADVIKYIGEKLDDCLTPISTHLSTTSTFSGSAVVQLALVEDPLLDSYQITSLESLNWIRLDGNYHTGVSLTRREPNCLISISTWRHLSDLRSLRLSDRREGNLDSFRLRLLARKAPRARFLRHVEDTEVKNVQKESM